MQTSQRLQINSLIDQEETLLRIKLKQAKPSFNLAMLINFRPNASLRQINNQRKLNENNRIHYPNHST